MRVTHAAVPRAVRSLLQNALLAGVLLTATSGCYRATFYRDPNVVKADEHEEWSDFYLFGLVGTESFEVRHFCPRGDAAVAKTGGNFATGLVSVVTIGIYTPRKVYVTCAAPSDQTRTAALDSGRQ